MVEQSTSLVRVYRPRPAAYSRGSSKTECLMSRTAAELTAGAPLPVRLHPAAPEVHNPVLVLHLHGGCFVGGSAETSACLSKLIADAGAVVLTPDYPLAPQHPFPQALNDLLALLQWMQRHATRLCGSASPRLMVAGEEAGAALAAGLALMVRDQGRPPLAGQILIAPMLDPSLATASLRRIEAGTAKCPLAQGWRAYLGGACNADHPYAAPMGAMRLAGLAPALVVSAVDDALCDEARGYARRLREAGVATEEVTLQSGTGWPASLCQSAPVPWAEPLQAALSAFMHPTRPPARSPRANPDIARRAAAS